MISSAHAYKLKLLGESIGKGCTSFNKILLIVIHSSVVCSLDFQVHFSLPFGLSILNKLLIVFILRYPDDPYDRIWESDLAKRQNFLVGVASGTERINTSRNIYISTREYPPMKVMQTAVVGTKGMLSYRLNLDDFPANARAYAYFAEIEDLGPNETRKFQLVEPDLADYNKAVVNIIENANGSYNLYEPSYMNVSLKFVLSFLFNKTADSTRGPLLNAIEISRYVEIAQKTDSRDCKSRSMHNFLNSWQQFFRILLQKLFIYVTLINSLHVKLTVTILKSFLSMSGGSALPVNGDPCLPVAWEWVICSSTLPPRVTKM